MGRCGPASAAAGSPPGGPGVAASHHRLAWIHPFLDGNGRVARLISHAMLKELGIGSTLWPVSRGLARSVADCQANLMAADAPRQGDLDGRGNLSRNALVSFCEYFLSTCLDQVRFMERLLAPTSSTDRIQRQVLDEERKGLLANGAHRLVRGSDKGPAAALAVIRVLAKIAKR